MTESKTILLVDDTPDNISLLIGLLRNTYKTRVATNGEKALKIAFSDSPPDLILLDILMPEMDGREVCRRLKESPATREIPVIFLTAKTRTDDIVKGFELGAVDYVAKPFNPAEVLARVKTHLELKLGRETILRQANERKELLHIMCHDLSNPIGCLNGFFDLIDKNKVMFSDVKEHLGVAIKNSMDIIKMVMQMRVLEENKFVFTLVSFNLSNAVQTARTILRQRADNKDLDILVDIDDQTNILAEEVSFVNSVLNNILTNAIKFSFPGAKIEVSARAEGESVAIAIKDTGIGMPVQLINNVFDVSKSTSRKGTEGESGTGFGMPLVKKFVTAYGGEIKVLSKEKTADSTDHGTEIRMILKSG